MRRYIAILLACLLLLFVLQTKVEACCNCTGCETCVDGECVDDDSRCPTCKVCSGGNCLNAPVGTKCGNCKECDGEGSCVYMCEGCESCVEGSYGTYHCEDDDDKCPGACNICAGGNCYDLCEDKTCCTDDLPGTYCCDPAYCQECDGGSCKTCNNDPCQLCCDGTCYNWTTHGCCDGLTIYDKATEKCCNQGSGHTCEKSPVDKECCAGDCCNESCCNSSDCEHCDSWACEPCLRKASNYAELEGCSKVVDDPDSEPSPNGCSAPLEDGDNPTGCEDTSFLESCNAHDTCYGTCNSNQDSCDGNFHDAMLDVCSGSSCAVECTFWANAYYGSVQLWGEGHWKDAQVAECSCCDC